MHCWFEDQHDHSQAHTYIFFHRSAWRGRDELVQKPISFKLNEIGQFIYRFVPFCPPEGWRFAKRRDRLKSWQKSARLCQHLGRHDCWPTLLTVHLDELPHYTEASWYTLQTCETCFEMVVIFQAMLFLHSALWWGILVVGQDSYCDHKRALGFFWNFELKFMKYSQIFILYCL